MPSLLSDEPIAAPPRLRRGTNIRVVAPSRSLSIVAPRHRAAAQQALEALGFEISFGRHALAVDLFASAALHKRLDDLHEAYGDPGVGGILTAIGGVGCIDLLPHLDWDLLRRNPKPLCGYSDVTILLNAISHRTRTISYCGPHFSSFAMEDAQDFQARSFLDATASSDPVRVAASRLWSDDIWYRRGRRHLQANAGWSVLNEGVCEGTLVGGNLPSFLLLQGSGYAPSLENAILLVEETGETSARVFRQHLVSLSMQPGFEAVRGLVIGRFQTAARIGSATLRKLFASLPAAYRSMPCLANVDFGHTQPIATLPIGGRARMVAGPSPSITLLTH